MAINDVYKIRLENIAQGGEALGRIEGKPVFIEGGAPDETVLCRIFEENKTWARAELLEIIETSHVRIKSACAFYGKCGGCNLQHIDYNAQLESKTAILKDSFERISRSCPPEPEVFPSSHWEYRNRMQFHCFRQTAKNSDSPKFGLKGKRSGEIIAVSDCPIADNGIRKLLQDGGKALPLPPEKDRFTVFSRKELFLSEGGAQRGKIKLLEKEITLDAGIFFQSNIVMLEKLILELQKTASAADTKKPAADLYCGAGTFAIFLCEMFPKIILAEENKKAVGIAKENLRAREKTIDKTFEFLASRDTEWEKRLTRGDSDFGFAVVDPPRAGLASNLALALARKGPPLLAYVSCNPASLARDSKTLTGGGYKLKELKLFDFYPQTAHIESLAVFEK